VVRFLLKVLVIGLLVFLAAVGWVIYDGMNDSHGPASCAVVLGEAPQTGAEPDPVLQAQLDRVIELYREKVVPQVMVSGADASQRGDGEKVLSTMTQYLLVHGLPASAVLSDSKGTSLDASAGDVAAYLQQFGNPNVMIVAPYYEILRPSWRCGVRESARSFRSTWAGPACRMRFPPPGRWAMRAPAFSRTT
jgi:vancomycin permeability regulator SanA